MSADSPASESGKLGPLARQRAAFGTGKSRIIVQTRADATADALIPEFARLGARVGAALPLINGRVIEIPDRALAALADHPLVARISLDRPIAATMERTAATIGATTVRQTFGYDGTGVGVAIIDSGITSWHDDLASSSGGQRVTQFVDFVGKQQNAYDEYGHGTHVAGIIAGDGFDSGGARAGVAPGVDLIVLRVLDDQGNGRISDVIAALDYVLKKSASLKIRVVNLSIATGVYESYLTDPLTVATKRLVDAGIVVVAAAGNFGLTPTGLDAYGGITAPGNAPWVLTVGSSSHNGTGSRGDDQMAVFSSRGPSAGDYAAKPDLVAPGVGIESLSDPHSVLYSSLSPYLLSGTYPTGYKPYLSLSGTSMSAPVVTGAVALMLQANPALTPNAIKAILQYTAQVYPRHDFLTQGAGFLNAEGAVRLARSLAEGTPVSPDPSWSRHLLWGNQRVAGGVLSADASAWAQGVTWGAGRTPDGLVVNWGMICGDADCVSAAGSRWSAGCADGSCWTSTFSQNVVWGTRCGGGDCAEPWTMAAAYDESVVWGTSTDQSVVWGTRGDESVVWGTRGVDESVVWGTWGDESVVWGTSCSDTICKPVVWPKP